ncbi:MAG: ATP-binding protein [Bacteroidales bacterium]|jgi:MinD superfamily P-loop ATPase|nr:ATP-binding protein [Bacteroidales bacterium]
MEIAVLSGKGGTGKTSVSAALADLSHEIIVVDSDVDAANLYLVLNPDDYKEEKYISGHTALIDYEKCTQCGICKSHCRFDAIHIIDGVVMIDEVLCDGCKLCSRVCPQEAIAMIPSNKSRWYVGTIDSGKMVHARLAPGEENSGKLVQEIRDYAKKLLLEEHKSTILIDGPPGTGCPVISAITGVDKILIVTEPSKSAFHDLIRAWELTEHFNIPAYVLINKYDLNREISDEIEEWCNQHSVQLVDKIPFHEDIVYAMIACQSIVSYKPDSEISVIMKNVYNQIINE